MGMPACSVNGNIAVFWFQDISEEAAFGIPCLGLNLV